MIWGKVISFTNRGAQVGERIAALLPDARIERYARGIDASVRSTILARMVQQAMVDCNLIVFVGATGIAVRTIAPYLQGKAYDPAVLVVDENAQFVISLISGHLGGANALAEHLAKGLGAQPVITTATDGRGIFAVDNWAKANGCTVYETAHIRHISGALLRDEAVGCVSDYEVEGNVPRYIQPNNTQLQNGFMISCHCKKKPFENTLHLVPRILHLGIGCRKGVVVDVIEDAVQTVLDAEDIAFSGIAAVASIDLKKDEPGLCEFCNRHNLPFTTYTATELMEVLGNFSASDFVQKTVGVDNVCERAAIKNANGKLLYRKFCKNGVTVALAEENWRVRF